MRNKYWSETKFAAWIRGGETPNQGLSPEGWNEWEKTFKEESPIRFWISDTLLDKIQDVFLWPIDKVYGMKYYAVNRWITKTHALTASKDHIKRGQYAEFDHRILFCIFDELATFVEVECANMHFIGNQLQDNMRFWQTGKWKLKTFRHREAGLAHLEWEISLGDESPHQSEKAQIIKDLYLWWKDERPKRKDAYDESGWAEYCERVDHFFKGRTPEERKESGEILKKLRELEEKHENEDTEKLIQLIKIRGSLWT